MLGQEVPTEGRIFLEPYTRTSSTTSFPVQIGEGFRSFTTLLLRSWETWGSQGRRRWLSTNQGSECAREGSVGCSNTREQARYASLKGDSRRGASPATLLKIGL